MLRYEPLSFKEIFGQNVEFQIAKKDREKNNLYWTRWGMVSGGQLKRQFIVVDNFYEDAAAVVR